MAEQILTDSAIAYIRNKVKDGIAFAEYVTYNPYAVYRYDITDKVILPNGKVSCGIMLERARTGNKPVREVRLCDWNGNVFAVKQVNIPMNDFPMVLFRFQISVLETGED